LERKYVNAGREWDWQYVFPSSQRSIDSYSGKERRQSFATYHLQSGYDIRTVQESLGHKDMSIIMIYTHVLNRNGQGVRSPLENLLRHCPNRLQ